MVIDTSAIVAILLDEPERAAFDRHIEADPVRLVSAVGRVEAGMVIAMEPHIGNWHLQDLILITDGGPKLLSDRFNTDEMFVIA